MKHSSPFHTLHLVQLSTAMVEAFSMGIDVDAADDDVDARISSPLVILTKLKQNQVKHQISAAAFMIHS